MSKQRSTASKSEPQSRRDAQSAPPQDRGTLTAKLRALIVPGQWKGEIVKPSSISFGGTRQQGDETYAIEHSYCFLIAFVSPPNTKTELPLIIVLMTGQNERYENPASFFVSNDLLQLVLSLHTNRAQFSDLVRYADEGRLGALTFSLRSAGDGEWQASSCSIELKPGPR